MSDLENLKQMKTHFDIMWQLMDGLSGDYASNDHKRVLHGILNSLEDSILRAITAEVMKETEISQQPPSEAAETVLHEPAEAVILGVNACVNCGQPLPLGTLQCPHCGVQQAPPGPPQHPEGEEEY